MLVLRNPFDRNILNLSSDYVRTYKESASRGSGTDESFTDEMEH